MHHIEEEVIHWALDRGILQNSDIKTQMLKCVSEIGELSDAVIKGDKNKIFDGIGDALVCLAIVAHMEGVNLGLCFFSAYQEIKDRKGVLNSNGVFVKDQE